MRKFRPDFLGETLRHHESETSVSDTSVFGISNLGISALELLVAMAVLAIVGGIGFPQVSGMTASYERLHAQSMLIKDLRLSQTIAISEGCRGVLTIATDGLSYTFGCDYLPYDTATPATADSINYTRELAVGVKVSSDAQILYTSRGHVADASGNYATRSVSFYNTDTGSDVNFANGTLNTTGILSYD